jgi:Coenzyme PQQ synthesis protein D (PqqD)
MGNSRIMPDDNGKQVYQRSVELLEADIKGELVALEPRSGACFGFNGVATAVWRMLEQPQSFDEIRNRLLAEFEVGQEQCTAELGDLLTSMRDQGLVSVSRSSPS